MKLNYVLVILFSLAMLNTNAQFLHDFEDCTGDGDPYSISPWTDWNCGGGVGCAILCSTDQAHSGNYSGLIPDDNTTNAVLNLGNKIFGKWCFNFWMYVPSGKEASWNLQGTVPISGGESIVGNIFFNQDNVNPGVGLIDDSALGPISFNFPHDQWFRIIITWDINSGISLATWEFYVDIDTVIPNGTPFTNQSGDIPSSLGGMNFFSNSTDNWYYLDDFDYVPATGNACTYLGIQENRDTGFLVYPNPVADEIYLQANQEMTSISIRNILGQEIYSSNLEVLNHSIDISHFTSGTYFIQVSLSDRVIIKKFIKK